MAKRALQGTSPGVIDLTKYMQEDVEPMVKQEPSLPKLSLHEVKAEVKTYLDNIAKDRYDMTHFKATVWFNGVNFNLIDELAANEVTEKQQQKYDCFEGKHDVLNWQKARLNRFVSPKVWKIAKRCNEDFAKFEFKYDAAVGWVYVEDGAANPPAKKKAAEMVVRFSPLVHGMANNVMKNMTTALTDACKDLLDDAPKVARFSLDDTGDVKESSITLNVFDEKPEDYTDYLQQYVEENFCELGDIDTGGEIDTGIDHLTVDERVWGTVEVSFFLDGEKANVSVNEVDCKLRTLMVNLLESATEFVEEPEPSVKRMKT